MADEESYQVVRDLAMDPVPGEVYAVNPLFIRGERRYAKIDCVCHAPRSRRQTTLGNRGF